MGTRFLDQLEQEANVTTKGTPYPRRLLAGELVKLADLATQKYDSEIAGLAANASLRLNGFFEELLRAELQRADSDQWRDSLIEIGLNLGFLRREMLSWLRSDTVHVGTLTTGNGTLTRSIPGSVCETYERFDDLDDERLLDAYKAATGRHESKAPSDWREHWRHDSGDAILDEVLDRACRLGWIEPVIPDVATGELELGDGR
jgi:hypothetical protein